MKKIIIFIFGVTILLSGCSTSPSATQKAITDFGFAIEKSKKSFIYTEYDTTSYSDLGETDIYSSEIPFFEASYDYIDKIYTVNVYTEGDNVYSYQMKQFDNNPIDPISASRSLILTLKDESDKDSALSNILVGKEEYTTIPDKYLFTYGELNDLIYNQSSVFNENIYANNYEIVKTDISDESYKMDSSIYSSDKDGNIYIKGKDSIITLTYDK